MERTLKNSSPKKIRSFSLLRAPLLIIAFLTMTNGLVKAQCNASVAPFICFNNNPVASGITTTTADLNAVTSKTWDWMINTGYVWGTVTGPTIASPGKTTVTYPTGTIQSGSTGTPTITGLNPGTTYYLRAYTTDAGGNTIYGTEISFTTTSAGPIGMTTTAASGIGPTSASTGGSVTILSGSPTIVERGVVYATATNPTTGSSTKVTSGSGTGSYTTALTGLTSSTTYYVRAYSIDNLGNVYYGPNISFTTSFQVSGIVSPFSLSPAWNFGHDYATVGGYGAKYTFPSGSFPAVPPSNALPGFVGAMQTNAQTAVETSTGVSFRDGSVAIYSNTMQAWNGGQTSPATYARNFAPGGDATCGGSSTGGGVTFPDPANETTNDAFYMVLGNDLTGGGCAGAGINRYRFTGTGTSVAYNAGPTLMATSALSSEAITAGTDGDGGYWVVSHDQAANNKFYVWHFTSSGVTGPTTYTPATAAAVATTTSGGYLKFSPCMDKIAFAGFQAAVSVYNFNRKTGAIGTELASVNTGGAQNKVGLEFSPDGNRIFWSGQGLVVNWFLISSPATNGTVAGSASWTLQMGPDAQIYTSGIEMASTVGVITDPNATAGHTPINLVSGSKTYRGLTNISWLSPQLPKINTTISNCNVDFSYVFKNYFGDDVTLVAGSHSWDFGDGSPLGTGTAPSHTYPSGTNSYNVTLTFRDSYCNQLWTVTKTVNTSCTVLPVNFLTFKGQKEPEGNVLYWSTSSEINNDRFEILKSDDGTHFYSIGTVNGINQSSGVSNYNFTDYYTNNKSVTYYQLAQYDKDGKVTYSTIITIRSEVNIPTVSPNPSAGSFKVSLPYDKTAVVSILDVLGRVIEKKTMEENNAFVIVGEELSKGSYIISIVTENDRFFYKVIKE